jgi:hypothetical protein
MHWMDVIPNAERFGHSWAIPETAEKTSKQKSGPRRQETVCKEVSFLGQRLAATNSLPVEWPHSQSQMESRDGK